MKIVTLDTDQALRIFMDPMRQRILKRLQASQNGMTAKQLATAFSITPSSAKHHLEQLESIALVFLLRTEMIHGITAKYYAAADVSIHYGEHSETKALEHALTAQLLQEHTEEFFTYSDKLKPLPLNHLDGDDFYGFCSIGVAHLSQADAAALKRTILAFFDAHRTAGVDTFPINYALSAFPALPEKGATELAAKKTLE